MINRLLNLQNLLNELNYSSYFISDMRDIRYLSGFTGTTAYMFVTANEARLFTDGRYSEQVKQEVCSDIEVTIVERYLEVFEQCGKYGEVILQSSCTVGISNILQECGANISVDSRDILKRLRMVKSSDEIILIKQQYELAANAFNNSLSSFVAGVEEQTWATELEYNMKKLGAKAPSFETIVASGVRGAQPHGVASNKIVEKSDPVIIDFGSENGYTSDYTRMLYNGGDAEVNSVISIVYDALSYAINGIKVGMAAGDIDKIARDYITSEGYGEYFNHSLGHGVGLDVHELPTINKIGDITIENGMVFTIEPGIYLPGKFGVRLEDTVLINNDRVEVISAYLDKYTYIF